MSRIARILQTAMIAAALTAGAAGCGASSSNESGFIELPARVTTATLAGPLCEGAVCRCREPGAQAEVGLPERPGWTRYEVSIGPVQNELWVVVDGMVLYKSVERARECFYIDLPTGKHPVTLRAAGTNGVAARLSISEIGAHGSYDTFDFACGGPGLCDFDQLDDWRASLARYQRNAHDPCGSTKIHDIRWDSGEAPDRRHPNQLQLDFVLQVYEFSPKHPSGHPACADND